MSTRSTEEESCRNSRVDQMWLAGEIGRRSGKNFAGSSWRLAVQAVEDDLVFIDQHFYYSSIQKVPETLNEALI